MRSIGRGLIFSALCGCLALSWGMAGCSDDSSSKARTDTGGNVYADGPGPVKNDLGGQTQDQNTAPQCQCAPGQVCDINGNCLNKPQPQPTDSFGEIMLLHQTDMREITVLGDIWNSVGKGEAFFKKQEAMPEDYRTVYTTPDGEKCYYEFGTLYPHTLPDYDWWPKGPGLSGGDLTIKVTGGAGDILLDELDASGDFIYGLGDQPPYLQSGSSHFKDFFEAAYVPFGARFDVDFAGGQHIGAQTVTGGVIPLEFTMVNPPAEMAGATAPAGQPLTVTWNPPQPSAQMKISLSQDQGGPEGIALLRCYVNDDGSATIPVDALSNFFSGTVNIYMERNFVRYVPVPMLDGSTLHLDVIGRHARYGDMELN